MLTVFPLVARLAATDVIAIVINTGCAILTGLACLAGVWEVWGDIKGRKPKALNSALSDSEVVYKNQYSTIVISQSLFLT